MSAVEVRPDDHTNYENQNGGVVGSSSHPLAKGRTKSKNHPPAGEPFPVSTKSAAKSNAEPSVPDPSDLLVSAKADPQSNGDPLASEPSPSSSDDWLTLRIWAEMFHDAQQQRIASVNRAERGGVDPSVYAAYIESLETAEKLVRRSMVLAYRRTVPASVRQWVKDTPGLGESTMARLLGHLGHPRIATPHHWEGKGSERVLVADPPFERTVGQLWQYCGHGRPGRPQKGASAEDLAALGSPNLKMLVHLCAESTMKQKANPGPHRLLYDELRIDYMDKVHSVPCVRCGPSGKPAQVGSPWSLGHQSAAALRVVGKELLRELWVVSA